MNKILCEDQDSLVTKIPSQNHDDSLLTSKNMDQKSKYNAAFRLGQEISNKLKVLKQKEFEYALSQLLKFNELLDKKIELKVISSESLAGDDGDEQTLLNDSVSSQSSTTSITSTTNKVFYNFIFVL